MPALCVVGWGGADALGHSASERRGARMWMGT